MKRGLTIAGRRLWGWALLLGWVAALALVVVAALLERQADAALAADRTVLGAVFGLAIPVLCYALVTGATGHGALPGSLDAVARHGGSRRGLALGLLAFVMIASAFGGLLLGATGVFIARAGLAGRADPLLTADLLATSWAALLAAATYTALFGFGSCIGRRGGGRSWLLLLDWLFGRGTGVLALIWPRAHVRNLLGAEPVLGLSQTTSAAALIVLGTLFLLASLRRLPP